MSGYDDLDRFCIYCQVEYETADSLARHIHKQHPGTYAAQRYRRLRRLNGGKS